jgi:hypothetical protein
VEAAGIAPAEPSQETQYATTTCVDSPLPCLHTVCTDAALRELVANWHLLTPSVRDRILDLAGLTRA